MPRKKKEPGTPATKKKTVRTKPKKSPAEEPNEPLIDSTPRVENEDTKAPEKAEKPKKKGNIANLRSFNSETARAAQKASTERKRAKKDMRQTIHMLMELAASGNADDLLKRAEIEVSDRTNMAAFCVKLYNMAMCGNLKAAEMLAEYGGLTGEENRKDNEDRRRTRESEARVAAIQANLGKDMQISSGDDEGDVIIYMPKLEEEPKEEDL